MIKKIAHIADVHIRKSPTRHDEYRKVFNNLYKSLKKQKPDRIVIVGDLNHDYIEMQGEQLILACEFLTELSKIAPVRITRGNHDCKKKSLNRMDSVEAIVTTLNNPNIVYYNETNFFNDDNVTWAVWHHGDKKSPWSKRKKNITENNTIIDLFHDPLNGSKSTTGYEFKSKTYISPKNFKGHFAMLGDIHKLQYFNNNTCAYPSSLVAQNFGEGDDDFHGYLLWDIETLEVVEVPIENDWSYKTVFVNPFTDFDDLEIDIDNPTKKMNVRIKWQTLPATRTKENERKIVDYLKDYAFKENIATISHKNEFIEEEQYENIEEEKLDVENIQDQAVQHEVFKEHLERIGVESSDIEQVIELDNEITSRVDKEAHTNIQWDVVKLWGKNFMSYENLVLDWRDMNGLYQIGGLNTAGKTTIMKLITYILYNKTLETESRMKFGDQRYVNNRNGAKFCEGGMVISVNGEYYGIYRKTEIEKDKNGNVKASPTNLMYYILETPDDEFRTENNLESLGEKDRFQTQAKIEKAIGSYENFNRVVMTTSDTLNQILSNNKAEFIDSILYDSGLDIFDKKLQEFKKYEKDALSKPRVNCKVDLTEEQIRQLEIDVKKIESEVDNLERVEIPKKDESIETGKTYVESLIKKLYKIDEEIYKLNVDDVLSQIDVYDKTKQDYEDNLKKINMGISELRESFDVEKLNTLLEEKEKSVNLINDLRIKLKDEERKINDEKHNKAILNGQILQLKKEGKECKEKISELKDSKTCPTCGQLMTEEHQKHVEEEIKKIEEKMFNELAPLIKTKQLEINNIDNIISDLINYCAKLNTDIDALNDDGMNIIEDIGELNIHKQEVEKRKELQVKANEIPIKIENIDLNIKILNDKLIMHSNMEKHIEENHKIESGIKKAKEKVEILEFEKKQLNDVVYSKKTLVAQNISKIKDLNELILEFTEQEKQDEIRSIYKKCIHRDGIPTQLLVNHAIPKINSELGDLLDNVPFSVWLDPSELKLKLAYNNRIDAVIDAISASGKERTFSAIALKFALNQINAKSKPTLFLLDEVMGKLTEDSVEEFVIMLHAIKTKMNKILIVEHNHELAPDYIINVSKNENDFSTLIIE